MQVDVQCGDPFSGKKMSLLAMSGGKLMSKRHSEDYFRANRKKIKIHLGKNVEVLFESKLLPIYSYIGTKKKYLMYSKNKCYS